MYTFASSTASGSCLSTSLEKSLSGLSICPSDMMRSDVGRLKFGFKCQMKIAEVVVL